MTDAKPDTTPFAEPTAEQDAAFDKAALEILGADEEEPEAPSLEAQEAPEVSEPDSDVDADALEEAHGAYRRDGLSDDEIESRLKKLGYKQFVARGGKRAKKHREDDDAYAELRRLRQEQEPKGTTPEKGAPPQAGRSTLNLREVAAPLVERLALDGEGEKALVATLETVSKAYEGEVLTLREQQALITKVISDQLLEGARNAVGLDQIDDEDWFRVQEHYNELLGTNLHGSLTGKPRMNALLRSAAKLAGVKGADPEEIQRKASIASAKKNGAPVVSRSRTLPQRPLTNDEIFDLTAKRVFAGASAEETRAYADKLRAHGRK